MVAGGKMGAARGARVHRDPSLQIHLLLTQERSVVARGGRDAEEEAETETGTEAAISEFIVYLGGGHSRASEPRNTLQRT